MRLFPLVTVFTLAACGPDTSTLSQPDMRMLDLSMAQPMECANGFTDGQETDQDCGGPTCTPCDTGKSCKMGRDCLSTFCTNSVCDAPSCSDGVKNGTESDQDCGGSCAGCAVGKKCNGGSDCQSMTCTNGTCAASPCSNGKQDGAETDVDCGGGTCEACADGKMCQQGTDCKSGTCTNNVCKSPLMCMAGTADCDGNAGNGCEVNTGTDAKNCGGCGKVCPMNTPMCVTGACKAQVEVKVGNYQPFKGSATFTPGNLFGVPLVLPQAGTLVRFGLVAGNPNCCNNPHVVLALYADKNNGPDKLQAATPITAVQGGMQEIAVPQVILPAGTYWIAFMVDSQSLPIPNDTQAKMIPSVWIGQLFNDPPPQQYPVPAGKGTQFPVNLWIVVLQ